MGHSTINAAIPPRPRPEPQTLAGSVAEALRGYLYSAVQAGKDDAVILPIHRPNGVRSLEIICNVSGMYWATVTEPAIQRAIATIRRLDDLDAILEPYGVTYDSDSEQLTSEPVRLFARFPERVWALAQCCLVIFAAADALTEPIVTVQPEIPKRDTTTEAIVAAGDVLRACERECRADLFPAWDRLLTAVSMPKGADDVDFLPLVASLDGVRRTVTLAMANLNAADAHRHWREADRLVRSMAAEEARMYRSQANRLMAGQPENDPHDGAMLQQAADLVKQAHVYEQIAAGLR